MTLPTKIPHPSRLICAECGSDNIYGSARVTWDDTDGQWIIEGGVEAMHCRTCERRDVEVHIVEINRPLSSTLPVFMRAKRFSNEEKQP